MFPRVNTCEFGCVYNVLDGLDSIGNLLLDRIEWNHKRKEKSKRKEKMRTKRKKNKKEGKNERKKEKKKERKRERQK